MWFNKNAICLYKEGGGTQTTKSCNYIHRVYSTIAVAAAAAAIL